MAAQFQFVMRSGPTVGKVFTLNTPEITIGRDATNTIPINDAEVSRRHARMELRGTAYVIQDLGSTNGTFVNGVRINGMQVLNAGDTVAFGEGNVLVYEPVGDLNATMLSPRAPQPTAVQKPAPAPTPAPAYSGQVPDGPVPMPPAASATAKKKFPVWLIIILVVFFVIVCGCAGFFWIIDANKLWCQVLPFLVPLLGGTCA